jgi:CRP/FNR family transcriptional regulator, cyclic AMP receptor protein
MSSESISVLQLDPDLALGIERERLELAVAACRARVERLSKGPWEPAIVSDEGPSFGLLVLSGFLVRRVGRPGRHGAELLGPGDLLRPWLTLGAAASEAYEPSWQAVAAVELAVLDHAFARRVAPFPSVAAQLIDRAMLRSRHLALELAVVQQPRIDERLHMLFWQLADRWGRTTADGVRVDVPLTHALLAELVAARRPSVTTALGILRDEGSVRRSGSAWILHDGPPAEIADETLAERQSEG